MGGFFGAVSKQDCVLDIFFSVWIIIRTWAHAAAV